MIAYSKRCAKVTCSHRVVLHKVREIRHFEELKYYFLVTQKTESPATSILSIFNFLKR